MSDRSATATATRPESVREALELCLRREHLRRTATIALCVGTLLTLINHANVIVAGEANTVTALKVAANFIIPFAVSNLGLLGARPAAAEEIRDEVEGSLADPDRKRQPPAAR